MSTASMRALIASERITRHAERKRLGAALAHAISARCQWPVSVRQCGAVGGRQAGDTLSRSPSRSSPTVNPPELPMHLTVATRLARTKYESASSIGG